MKDRPETDDIAGTILALDVGTRRIGVAVSDDRQSMALPLETVDARSRSAAIRRIGELMDDYGVGAIVVGWPIDMHGRQTRAVDLVRELLASLEAAMKAGEIGQVQIYRWDERMTTMAAERLLDEAQISSNRRAEVVDQVAACEILEGFLASRSDETD